LASQDLVSSIRGSGSIEQLALAKDGRRERGLEDASAVEALTGPDEHVGGNAGAPEGLVGQSAAPTLRRGRIRDDEEQIVIAVEPGVSARPRTEEIDPFGLVDGDETANDFGQARGHLGRVHAQRVSAEYRPPGDISWDSGRLEVLKTLIPTIGRVWAIYYADDPSSLAAVRKAEEAASRLGLALARRPVRSAEELERAFGDIRPGDALLPPDIATMDIPAAVLEVSLSSRVPAVFPASLWVGHGGLVSYGSDYHAQGVQAARLVAKILKGTRPQELPVEGAAKIDLAVNLKTANLLGVTVPRKVLLRADLLRR
jgi:hypothetical protein